MVHWCTFNLTFYLSILGMCFGNGIISAQSPTYSKEKILIDSLLTTCHSKGQFNGNAVVSIDGSLVYQNQHGYASGDKDILLRSDHLFSLGSMAKSIHVTSILMLIEQGAIGLEDKLSKYMTDLPSWSDLITINHLLNYASGLPQLRFSETKNEADVFKHLGELDSLQSDPGLTYLYNHNTPIIYKSIIERASGMSFENFVYNFLMPKAGLKMLRLMSGRQIQDVQFHLTQKEKTTTYSLRSQDG